MHTPIPLEPYHFELFLIGLFRGQSDTQRDTKTYLLQNRYMQKYGIALKLESQKGSLITRSQNLKGGK